jgi:CYTH domain-containing protein
MSVTRRFLIAPSLARLIRRSLGASRLTEAHMATGAARHVHVHIEPDAAHLVLSSASGTEWVPLSQAQADNLVEAAAGRVTYDRTEIDIDGARVRIDSFVAPGPLDVAEIELSDEGAELFVPPIWLGHEITREKNCDNRSIALHSLSLAVEMPISDAIVESVLDLVDQQELRTLLGRAKVQPPVETPTPVESMDHMDAAVAA